MSFYSFYGGKRGHSFVISKKYKSIREMELDFGNPDCQVEIGQFVLIDVNYEGKTSVDAIDTGKLYQRDITGPLYITDLSGPTGKTPIIGIGNVSAPEGEKDTHDTVKVTTSNNYDEDTGDYLGSDLNFEIPVPKIKLSVETGPQGSDVQIKRVVEDGQTTDDTKFTPHYHMIIPRGSRGISIDNVRITEALDGSEQSHLIIDYVDPSYPEATDSIPPYSSDLGLIKTIEKLEVDRNANLNCYYSNNPTTPVKLVTIRYITEFNKEPDAVFGEEPSGWTDISGGDSAKVYARYSDTGFEKHYIGTLNSILKIGKVLIPKDDTMKQNAQKLLIAMADGRVVDLGDIRGCKGDPGDPLQIYTYYETLDEIKVLGDKDKVIGLKPAGDDTMILYFYDQERQEWVSLGSVSDHKGSQILVQEDEPGINEQTIGDAWFISEPE